MTQPDFGRDLLCLTDLDPAMSEVSGWTCLAQALARRLQTPLGTLIGDPDYGYDLLGEIDDDITDADIAEIATNIDAEFVKDQRVLSSTTTAVFSPSSGTSGPGTLLTTSTVVTAAGPFSLVLAASDVLTLLKAAP